VDAATRLVLMHLIAADQWAEQQACTTSAVCWWSAVHICHR
jgi:hypothetical protein